MKNILFSIVVLFLITSCSSPLPDSSSPSPFPECFGDGHFFIKGKVKNKSANIDSWELRVGGYISFKDYIIPVADDGSFEKEIPITDVQDIYLGLGNDVIKIFSYPGDTIEVYFNNNRPKKTLRLKGKNADRDKELALCMLMFDKYFKSYSEISGLSYNRNLTEDELLSKLNNYYDNTIKPIKSFEEKNGRTAFFDRFIDEAYFQTIQLIATRKILLPKIHCEYPNEFAIWVRDNSPDEIFNFPLNYDRFRTSSVYRAFLDPYVSNQVLDKMSPQTYYNVALSCLKIEGIRDWYVTEKLNFSFVYHDFTETTFVYDEFKKICTNENYLSLLKDKYKVALQTQPGNPAPDFELKDETGKTVRLSDLRGKTVYIDFWSMGCGVCIYEFQNSTPELYERYKDFDIVYVYINIGDNDANWKKGIKAYNLKGINLTAGGWSGNSVCQSYNVLGIPHHVLIDKEGKIVKNNCAGPYQIIEQGEKSEFDKVVKGMFSL